MKENYEHESRERERERVNAPSKNRLQNKFGTYLGVSMIFFLLLVFSFSTMPQVTHAAYRDTVQADTPLYYWPMDEAGGATSLTAVVGGTAINLTGATAGASGQVNGTAVSFNGTSNFGATASSLNLTAYNKIVVEGLFYTDAYNNTNRMTWEFSASAASNITGFFYAQDLSGPAQPLLSGNVGFNFATYSRPSAANWHHIVTVFDKGASSNEVDLYVDGVKQTAASRPINANNTNNFGDFILYLMSRAGSTFFSQGKLQHLAVYSDLSESRIIAHYNEAFPSQDPLSAGILSEVAHTDSSVTLSWTSASGGSLPVTTQLQRSLSGASTWANVSGATVSPVNDTGLSAETAYDYRVVYTDATPTVVYSNTVTATTDVPSSTYTIQQSDLWDNGYDNVSVPRQSAFARLVFATDAASITIGGTTSIYGNYPQFSHLGVRIDGVDQSSLIFTANGSQSFVVPLGVEGTMRTVEIISGLQSKPGTVLGSFIDSITYPDTAALEVQIPTEQTNRILVYGDSIAVGGNATNPEIQAYVPLIRNTYGESAMLEGWGYRTLYEDTNTSGLRSAFVGRIDGYAPSIIWLAIGTNDYALNSWSATNFGTAYAATLDDLHTALPSARIVCQTPIVRSSEIANSFGNTLSDYRSQISTVCNARSWTTLVDGSAFLTTSDLADGVHPSTAGHAKYALKINDVLTITPTLTTSAASSVLSTSATLNGSISSVGSTTPTVRGFVYGLTTAYEIATTTDSGSFNTGNFNASISNLTLTANTIYHFRSYATNFAGTSYGIDQSFTTLIQTPNNLFASSNSNSITLTVDSFPNATSGSSGYYFSRSDANSGWIQTNSWQDTGLSCGNSYDYSVKYRNGDGIETDTISIVGSTSGCGSSSGSSRRSIPNPELITPSTPTPTICNPGDRFNSSTGLLCTSNTTPTTCPVGHLFSSITGLPCTQTVTNTTFPPSSCSIASLILKQGDRGPGVTCLQTLLKILPADGIFGPQTKAAVILFQNSKGLVQDGIVGPKTRASLASF